MAAGTAFPHRHHGQHFLPPSSTTNPDIHFLSTSNKIVALFGLKSNTDIRNLGGDECEILLTSIFKLGFAIEDENDLLMRRN
ncbi:hypothetical protein L2E82_06344 [Cichorium intybus]|uniref:Uncharacterized protein n=1 Tax=Cichorium intybus TaxID=13427 RepID=A0ACB9H9L8_CICIN|nr:hypothetical protein L2E82_06344 [Cichorium intybus]